MSEEHECSITVSHRRGHSSRTDLVSRNLNLHGFQIQKLRLPVERRPQVLPYVAIDTPL